MKELWSRVKALLSDNPAPRHGRERQGSAAGLDEEDTLAPSQLASLGELVTLLAARLGPRRAAAYAQQAVDAADRDMGSAMAFASGTNTNVDFALSLYLDWDGCDEIEWQINKVLETLELDDRWRWEPDVTGRSMPAAFTALEHWLAARGYHVWHVKTEGDDALLFPVERKDVELAKRTAEAFGMRLFTLAESKPHYGAVE